MTAYHEMGHALVGHYLDQDAEVHKISIISRGQALGYTIRSCARIAYLTTKSSLMDQLAMTLGGRARRSSSPQRGDHGRRPREGHPHRGDDHALRDEREARAARAGRQSGHASPGPRDGLSEPDYSEDMARATSTRRSTS